MISQPKADALLNEIDTKIDEFNNVLNVLRNKYMMRGLSPESLLEKGKEISSRISSLEKKRGLVNKLKQIEVKEQQLRLELKKSNLDGTHDPGTQEGKRKVENQLLDIILEKEKFNWHYLKQLDINNTTYFNENLNVGPTSKDRELEMLMALLEDKTIINGISNEVLSEREQQIRQQLITIKRSKEYDELKNKIENLELQEENLRKQLNPSEIFSEVGKYGFFNIEMYNNIIEKRISEIITEKRKLSAQVIDDIITTEKTRRVKIETVPPEQTDVKQNEMTGSLSPDYPVSTITPVPATSPVKGTQITQPARLGPVTK
jgi:hypothetical protein